MRRVLWRVLWEPVFGIWAIRFTVEGRIPLHPVVFAPNHSSHADTAAMQFALARAGRGRVMAAGAEDYFFRNRLVAFLARLIGVYPFPREGRAGIERGKALLRRETSVILYPQGTRAGGPFRHGVFHLAESGFEVVPVTIEGTGHMLPRGSVWPRRAVIRLRFGEPISVSPGESASRFVARLESKVLGPTRIEEAA